MTTITLRNDFHNSESNIRVADLPHEMTESQNAKVQRELCGNRNCECGGIRGVQHSNGKRLDVEFLGGAKSSLVISERPCYVPECDGEVA
jgi:hypothetical protein